MLALQDDAKREYAYGLPKGFPTGPELGALAVDFVGRYENLQDLNKALASIGAGRIEVPRTNVNPSREGDRDYRRQYSDGTRALVEAWYQPEIKMLGYGS